MHLIILKSLSIPAQDGTGFSGPHIPEKSIKNYSGRLTGIRI